MRAQRVHGASLAVIFSGLILSVVLCGCGAGARASTRAVPTVIRATIVSTTAARRGPGTAARDEPISATDQATGAGSSRSPLSGEVVGVDPGHNGANATDPTYIDHQIWNGREFENCNTTGTETDAGYTEARFNWNVARFLVGDLNREGARVVLTRHSNDGVGPCVNRRAQIFNNARVAVAVAIHADGASATGRGFAILEPVPDRINTRAVAPSDRFARILRTRFLAATGMPESTYDGVDGLKPRDDLAGANLTRVPYALIECGNMRNATDAALLTSPRWQRRAAAGIAVAITHFLTRPRVAAVRQG